MALIGSEIRTNEAFLKNAENFRKLHDHVRTVAESIRAGGGLAAIEKHHGKGKLTARERIGRLIDPGSYFLEIGLFAAFEMYEEYGGAPSSGTIFGIGKIHGREAVIVANDATVKAGALPRPT